METTARCLPLRTSAYRSAHPRLKTERKRLSVCSFATGRLVVTQKMFFFDVKSPSEARRLLAREPLRLPTETVPLAHSLGRVAALKIVAPHDLPEFCRSV